MKTTTGVVIAIFTIGLVFIGFGLRANSRADARQPIAAYAQPAGDARVMMQPVNAFTTSGAQVVPVNAVAQADQGWQAAPAAQQPVLVNCGPGRPDARAPGVDERPAGVAGGVRAGRRSGLSRRAGSDRRL